MIYGAIKRAIVGKISSHYCALYPLKVKENHLIYFGPLYFSCGLSYIGKSEPANSVYLSFGCQDPVGIAAHETMHGK